MGMMNELDSILYEWQVSGDCEKVTKAGVIIGFLESGEKSLGASFVRGVKEILGVSGDCCKLFAECLYEMALDSKQKNYERIYRKWGEGCCLQGDSVFDYENNSIMLYHIIKLKYLSRCTDIGVDDHNDPVEFIKMLNNEGTYVCPNTKNVLWVSWQPSEDECDFLERAFPSPEKVKDKEAIRKKIVERFALGGNYSDDELFVIRYKKPIGITVHKPTLGDAGFSNVGWFHYSEATGYGLTSAVIPCVEGVHKPFSIFSKLTLDDISII